MKLNDIVEEYEKQGRISQRSVRRLQESLLSSDPYEAITIATDCGVFDLVPQIAQSMDSTDPMVRWNAIGAVHTRFRVPIRVERAIDVALHDDNSMVRAIALVGLGELLPKIQDETSRGHAAHILESVFTSEETFDDIRAAAYEGILAAMDVLPLSRPPANRPLKIPQDIDSKIVQEFRAHYL